MSMYQRVRQSKFALFLAAVIVGGALGACNYNSAKALCDPSELLSPTSLSPGGAPETEGELVASLTPMLSWTYPGDSCRPEGFQLSLATNWHDLDTSPEIFRVDGSLAAWTPEHLLAPATTYLWSVQAVSGSTLVGGELGIFRTGPVCDVTPPADLAAPALLYPEDGARVEGLNPTLEWADPTACIPDGAYVIEISQQRDFSESMLGGYPEPYLFVAHPWVDFDLEECTHYYWRVHFDLRGHPDAEDGPYSATWSFSTPSTTGAFCPPGPVVTLVPGPGITVPSAAESAISGHVWHDECATPYESTDITPLGCVTMPDGGFEANGIVDAGEIGIEGVSVRLGTGVCPADEGSRITTTAANGAFSFTLLPAGTYCLSIDAMGDGNDSVLIPGWWTFPERNYGPDPIELQLSLGFSQILREVNFGWDYQFLPEQSASSTPASAAAPVATFIRNANCRIGPGTDYAILTSLLAGQTAPVEGQNVGGGWWWIRLAQNGAHCWVAQNMVEVEGDIGNLPYRQAPPTPTPTPVQGCWVWNAQQQKVCTVPCPPNAQPGGACTP